MNEEERYLFDLRGYLVIADMLTAQQLAGLNRLMDSQNLMPPGDDTLGARFGGFLEWGQIFCNLLDHARIMPYLKTILGDGFRLDHYYGIYMRAGTEQLRLHGGGTPYDPPEYYHFRDGQMHNGLTVVAWNLTDTGPSAGGFCALPGSHKSNYACPDSIRVAHTAHAAVEVPEAPAGSVVIFTEALTHGTAAWTTNGAHSYTNTALGNSPGARTICGCRRTSACRRARSCCSRSPTSIHARRSLKKRSELCAESLYPHLEVQAVCVQESLLRKSSSPHQ